jgi:hypothetical protein
MEVKIFDHYGMETEPRTFRGSVMQIEQQLRTYFKSGVGHIPFGDLYEMLRTLKRMTGLDIQVVDDESKPMLKKHKHQKTFRPSDDPWLREDAAKGDDNL